MARRPDSARWVSVRLDMSGLCDHPTAKEVTEHCFLANLARSPPPNLETLRLDNARGSHSRRCGCLDFSNFSSPPSALRRLTLYRCQPLRLALIISGVTHLSLHNVFYSKRSWMELLRACSKLQVLFIQGCRFLRSPDAPRYKIRLPELRVLHYVISENYIPMLKFLVAPKLQTFLIDDDFNEVSLGEIRRIKYFVGAHAMLCARGIGLYHTLL